MRTAEPRADRTGDQPGTPWTRPTRAAENLPAGSRSSIPIPEAKRRGSLRRENRANAVCQPAATPAHHPYAATVLPRQRSTRANKRPILAAQAGPPADGPGPGAAVQALCPPPARGGTPNGFPRAAFGGPLPDLPPAVLGMTRPAQVGAYTGGTPAFIPRPDTGLPVAKSSYLWTYPLSLPRPVRKSSLPLLPSTTGTLPPGCRRLQPRPLQPPPAERQRPNGQAAAATQNSGGSRCRSLRAAYSSARSP